MLWENVRKTGNKVFQSHDDYRRYTDYVEDNSVKLVQNMLNQYAEVGKSLDYSTIYTAARSIFHKLPSADMKHIFRIAIHHVLQEDSRFVQSGYEIQYVGANSPDAPNGSPGNSNGPDLEKIIHDYALELSKNRAEDERKKQALRPRTRQKAEEQKIQTTSPEETESLVEQQQQAKARAEKRAHEITALHNLCNAVLNFVVTTHEVSIQDAFTAVQEGCKAAQCSYDQGEVDDYIHRKAGTIVQSNGHIGVSNSIRGTIRVGKQFEQAANTVYQNLQMALEEHENAAKHRFTDADIINGTRKAGIIQTAFGTIIDYCEVVPVELFQAYYRLCCKELGLNEDAKEYQELVNGICKHPSYSKLIVHTYEKGERNDFSLYGGTVGMGTIVDEDNFLSRSQQLKCDTIFDNLTDTMTKMLRFINTLYLRKTYSTITFKKYFTEQKDLDPALVDIALSVLSHNEAFKKPFPKVNKQQFKRCGELDLPGIPAGERSAENTELMDQLEKELSKKISDDGDDYKAKYERLLKKYKLLLEKNRKLEAAQKFPKAVNDHAQVFTKLHNQLTGKHVPVVYALAGKFYTTHEMGLKIGRSTNIEQRLTLYERTLAQPSASNLWSTHTVVQGFALFSADDFENGLTVAYINSHIRETWYPVEAVFRVLFQLEFSAYNARGEGGRMREWFDFESKERLFDRARKLFELISKTISHTNSWIGKTPNQLRTEISKCDTVEQWLNQQCQK